MDSVQRFDGRADVYAMGRPSYASEFIESLYTQFGFSNSSVIADIGSGTGKFAKQLIERGSFVHCVEPNEDMRNAAVKYLKQYDNFDVVNGTETNTLLSDCSVDFVTVAQAFHWFDTVLFAEECKRILKPDGKVFLIWNRRDLSSEVNRRCFEICSLYCQNFKGFTGGMTKDSNRIKEFFNNNYQYAEFDNPLFYDKEKFISRCLSSSYSLKKGDSRYEEYISELEEVFEQYSENGILNMKNKTVAYFG